MYRKMIGGQAFPFGVVMRSGNKAALSVRFRNGEIKTVSWRTIDFKRYSLGRVPVIKTLLALSSTLFGSFYAIARVLLLFPQVFTFVSPLNVFRYHGAEHKTIRCYEEGLELSRENVMPMERFHPRCGTGVMIYVLLSELLAYIITPKRIYKSNYDLVSFFAFIVGLFTGYNAIMYSSKNHTRLANILRQPGILAQHLTVLQPRPYMVDCAIEAAKAVIS